MHYNVENPNPYTKMVMNLAKAGEDIITGLTPTSAHILHMAIGIIGECHELNAGLANNDLPNIREECGDLEFYIEGMLLVHPAFVPCGLDIGSTPPNQALLERAVTVLEYSKKHAVYAKDLEKDDLGVKLSKVLGELLVIRSTLYVELGLNHAEVKDGNMSKLLTATDARYSDGVYSDKQAHARADKNGAD